MLICMFKASQKPDKGFKKALPTIVLCLLLKMCVMNNSYICM